MIEKANTVLSEEVNFGMKSYSGRLKVIYLPDDHQHQLPAYQLRNAKDLHPAYFIVTIPESQIFFL